MPTPDPPHPAPKPETPVDPDRDGGPGGLTFRQIHALVQQSVARDEAAHAAPPPSRWQRFWQRIRHSLGGGHG